MPKTKSLRQVRSIEEVCAMPRDHYEYRDWSIMTDGVRVWISKQKVGQNRTDHIEVPKTVFDRLFDAYGKQRQTGEWRDEKFYKAP